jgi:undecaprenyl diphosphate synthase
MDPSIKLLPNHICIPMDGNGRWAKNRELSRSFGHKAGVEVVKKISRSCAHLGVKYLTLWAFSTENWSRPASEVSFLMRLLESVLRDEISSLIKDKVRLRVIGQRSRIPKSLVKMIVDAEEQTSIFSDFNLTIAVDYGGRDDICNATKMIAEKVKRSPRSYFLLIFIPMVCLILIYLLGLVVLYV